MLKYKVNVDSDFNFVTNQPEMVIAAQRCYNNFPTVVNDIPESGLSYNNTMSDFAKMDNIIAQSQKAIGGSSDTAQLALSYYFDNVYKGINDENTKHYYDNFVILAVLAQCAIDGCKRLYAIDVNEEIVRIRAQQCMSKEKDYPKFMKYTHKIPVTKNGKERAYEDIKKDRNKVSNRIDNEIVCPMNWMQECLEKIQGMPQAKWIDTMDFLVDLPDKQVSQTKLTNIQKIIEEYDAFVRKFTFINKPGDEDALDMLIEKSMEIYNAVFKMKVGAGTMRRLIEISLGFNVECAESAGGAANNKKKMATKYGVRTLNVLYRSNKEKFLSCFVKASESKE